MRFASKLAAIMLAIASFCAYAQQKINPATQINWPAGCQVYNASTASCPPVGVITFLGAWSSATTYQLNQAVYYNGSTYVSLQNGNLNQNPASATTFWTLLVTGGNPLGSPYYTAPCYEFGDSTGGGVSASDYAHAYFGILQASHASLCKNDSLGGNEASDLGVSIATDINYPTTTPYTPAIAVISTGVNDYTSCGVTASCQAIYTGAQEFNVTWTGMTGPQGHRAVAAAMGTTGTVTLDTTTYAQPVQKSTTNGSTIFASVTTNGNPIGIDYVVTNANLGVMSCRIDAGSPTTINLFPAAGGTISGNHPYGILRAELATAAGSHTVTCTVTSSTGGGNLVAIVAFDTVPLGTAPTNFPAVVMTDGTVTGGTASSAATTLQGWANTVYAAMLGEGLNVRLALTNAASLLYGTSGYNFNCPSNASYGVGGLHPNDCGHNAIAKAMIVAAPDAFVYNVGITPSVPNFYGLPPASIQQYQTFVQNGPTSGYPCPGIVPGGIWINPTILSIVDAGCYSNFAPKTKTLTSPVFRIGTPCFGNPGSPTASNQSSWSNIAECVLDNTNHHYFWTTSDGTTTPSSVNSMTINSWALSRDNQVLLPASNATINPQSDILYIPQLSTPVNYGLNVCSLPGTSPYPAFADINFREEFFRMGTDGQPVTFAANTTFHPDTINGASTWTWTGGQQYDILEIQCSESNVGGTTWIATVIHGNQVPSTTGFATLSSGTVTVTNAAACAAGTTCIYKLTNCGLNGSTAVGTLSLGTVVGGTNFVINSESATATVATGDTSKVCWQIN